MASKFVFNIVLKPSCYDFYLSKKAQPVQEGSRCKGMQGGTSKEEIKCVCLNARSIINKKKRIEHYGR